MTAKEFLENSRKLTKLIESTRETLERLSDVHAVAINENRCARNVNNEVNKAIRRVELENKMAEYMEYLWDYKEALVRITTDSEISYLTRTLIQQRYMLGKSWKQVARFLDYDLVYTKRELNNEAIKEVEKRKKLWCGINFPY